MDDSERQGGKNTTAPVIAGLAVGVGLVLLFSIYGSWEKAPSPVVLPPTPDEEKSSEMPADFSVIYAYGIGAKNILNTANNTFTHDMVCDPTIQIGFTLSDGELRSIWNSSHENNFFELKNLTSVSQNIIPEISYSLTITANGQNHTVKLRQSYELSQGQDSDLHKFKDITATIDNILSQKEQLKQLPKPRCWYQ